MALLSKGRLRDAYPALGSFVLRYITVLMSEDTEFIFLSEDDSDVLISEEYKIPGGVIKQGYVTKGTYEREEL